MKIWVTRAEPGATATADRLKALGHEPLVGPLLVVRDVDGAPPTAFAALAFTSANGAAAFARRDPRRNIPVFTVGDATAAAARAAGYTDVRSADGDVEALAALILSQAPLGGILLHACAAAPAGDLVGALQAGGQAAIRLTVYETALAQALPSVAMQADAVLVHSPRAGEALAALAPPGAMSGMAAYGLSPSCTEPLAALGFRSLAVAQSPHEASLLALLPKAETPRPKGLGVLFWLIIAVAVLAVVTGLAALA
jgi:uroporphyrinogen-III synthase